MCVSQAGEIKMTHYLNPPQDKQRSGYREYHWAEEERTSDRNKGRAARAAMI